MRTTKRVLAVASGGGHWIQLLRLMPALRDCEVAYVTTLASYRSEVSGSRFYCVNDASRWNKFGLLRMAMRLLFIVLWERPDVIVSTGAAPGYFCVWIGKRLGAQTIWIDSMANADELSLCGQRIGRHADLWLTQWPHLARPEGPHFHGGVL